MSNRLGEIRKNHFGTEMQIIRYKSADDITIKFLDEHGYERDSTYLNFTIGKIRNPYDRTVKEMGYLGVGKYKVQYPDRKVNTVEYMAWKNMLERCYMTKYADLHPSYYGICEVCDEWHDLQNFAKWHEENAYECEGRLHLDKDIKYPGNTLYSPDTCLLVPQRINMLFMNKGNDRGLPNGITKVKNGYSARYNTQKLGVYTTLEEAFAAYAKKKKETIVEVANEYKSILPSHVYDALIAHEIRIEDDKNYKH